MCKPVEKKKSVCQPKPNSPEPFGKNVFLRGFFSQKSKALPSFLHKTRKTFKQETISRSFVLETRIYNRNPGMKIKN